MEPTRNNRGIAHENGSIESAHGHLKRAIQDALLLRGATDFEDLSAYRGFVDEVVSRKNARNLKRIEAQRTHLRGLPYSRASDYEETVVCLPTSGGFTLKKVFYTVPSRLIGRQLRVRVYDDRLELFIGGTHLMQLVRGRAGANGTHGHVVNYHHMIHALRRKPMALLNLVYRDQLFPREAYRLTFEQLREHLTDREACRSIVELLSLAHDRSCEAQLAEKLTEGLEARQLPDLPALRACFGPDPDRVPVVAVQLTSLSAYETLLDNLMGEAA